MKTMISIVVTTAMTLPVCGVVTNITSGGALYATIQAAVNAANNGDTLLVSTGLYNERVVIAGKALRLLGGYWGNFVIRTNVAAATCINAGGGGTGVAVLSNKTVVLERLMITNGVNLFAGGLAVDIQAVVTAEQCEIAHNLALGGGGAGVFNGSILVMVDTRVHHNMAQVGGGLCGMPGTRIELRGSYTDIRNNHAEYGGGVYALGAQVDMSNGADIYGNIAVRQGGGMYLSDGATGVVSGSGTVIGVSPANRATNEVAEGGGVYVRNARLIVQSKAAMSVNHATQRGGAIYVTNGSVVIEGARIGTVSAVSNTAVLGGGVCAVDAEVVVREDAEIVYGHAQYGGGVYLWRSTGLFDRVVVRENKAEKGGGVAALEGSVVQVASSTLRSNHAATAGGMYCGRCAGVVISNTLLQYNEAWAAGGLVASECDEIEVSGGTRIEQNKAVQVGAAYISQCNAPRIHDVMIISNSAAVFGGVFCEDVLDFDIVDCDFVGNVATGVYCGALTVGYGSGQVRTEARPAMMVGNLSGSGSALVVASLARVELRAGEYPLVVASNVASGVGGGAWVLDGATVTVVGAVQFIGNTSAWGGAIFATNHAVITLQPTNKLAPVFIGNAAANNGGAINLMASSQVTAVNCTFMGNSAGILGGAIRNAQSYLRVVPNFGQGAGAIPTIFSGNRAPYGGAIHSYQAPLTLVDSALIISNVGINIGGGVSMMSGSPAQLINCAIARNSSAVGGGVAIDGTSAGQLRHCTIMENTSDGVVSAGGAMALSNCIVRGNTPGQITPGYTVHFSDVEGGYPGAGNIDADPLFVAPAVFNYALRYGSPCVNAGAAAGVTWDCIGKPRPMGAGYDMGAYEQDPAAIQIVDPTILDFGDVVVGDSATLPVSVMNTGNSGLTGTVNFVPAPIFTVHPGNYTVAPLQATNVLVTFSPPVEYHWTQVVQFASNGGSTNVTLIGTGIPEPMVMGLVGLLGLFRLAGRIHVQREP